MRRVYTFLLFLTALFVTPSCFWKPRRHHCIPRVEQQRVKEDLGVDVVARLLTPAQVKAQFWGVDVEAYNLAVIALSITNRGNKSYHFKPSYLSLTGKSYDEVAPLFHYDTMARVCWYSVPALIFWWPAIPLFVVPYGYYWRGENQKMTEWLSAVIIDARTYFEVGPYEIVDRFIFVEEPAPLGFSFSLFDEIARELVTHRISFVGEQERFDRSM